MSALHYVAAPRCIHVGSECNFARGNRLTHLTVQMPGSSPGRFPPTRLGHARGHAALHVLRVILTPAQAEDVGEEA